MIETVQLDVPLNILTSLLICWWAQPKLRQEKSFFNRYLAACLLYGVFVFAPVGAWLFVHYPDWSVMYLADPHGFDGMSVFRAIYAYLGGNLLGYALGYFLAQEESDRRLRVALIVCGVVIAGVCVAGIDRLLFVGTYTEYHSGRVGMAFIPFSALGLNMIWIGAYCGLPLGYLYLRLRSGW